MKGFSLVSGVGRISHQMRGEVSLAGVRLGRIPESLSPHEE
jgi:hypothetical protein